MLSDLDYMNRALDLAERGRGTTSPNPMVGAVIVGADGTVVGQGYHERAGEPHAEVRALDEAGDFAKGASLFCTLEPCCHVGRTGPCVERVRAAGISRVVAATVDADPRVSGRGFEFLRQKGIAVSVGTGRERALRLNRAYFTFKQRRRPFVIMKAATSLDNHVAARPGERTKITSNEAQRHAHSVRAEVDALAVGSGTVLIDDPFLTRAGGPPGTAPDPSGFRPQIACSAVGQAVLDARRRTGDDHHQSGSHRDEPCSSEGAGTGRSRVGADIYTRGPRRSIRAARRSANHVARARGGCQPSGVSMDRGSCGRRAFVCRSNRIRHRRGPMAGPGPRHRRGFVRPPDDGVRR